MDPSALAASCMGFLVPVLTQLVRRHLLPWNDRAAHFLALMIAAVCVSVAYFLQNTPHTWTGWASNFGLAFTLSQMVYQHLGGLMLPEPPASNTPAPPTPPASA